MNASSLADGGTDFRSDNTGPAAAEILAAIAAANVGTAAGYGEDQWTKRLHQRFSALFETDVRVFPTATGTAANALALAAASPPWGAIYCSRDAHIDSSEANAPSFFSGGAKLVAIDSVDGKILPGALEAALGAAGRGVASKNQPAVLSVTQATELGTVYRPDEVRALGAIARRHDLKVHMDGARLANAMARLGGTPAEATWKAGVDVVSFGMTKNGGLMCDAIVVFDAGIAERLAFLVRRAGQVWSKMRFAAAQLLAYVEDDLWIRNAAKANAAAARIGAGVAAVPGVRLRAPVEANEIFLQLAPERIDALAAAGIRFFRRGPDSIRLVCRYDTVARDIDALMAALSKSSR